MPDPEIMHIAIPSMGRATKVRSANIFPNATIYVPQSEATDYKRKYKNVVGVPNKIKGITPTRNWILDNTDLPWVVMIDDDVKITGWAKFYKETNKLLALSGSQLITEFLKLFEVTEDMNYRIWGTATLSDPLAVYPYRPFIFHTYVTASCMGILNHTGIRFDESFVVKEDYELCLRCITEDGGVVGARYLFWENEHWTTEGGCKSYRTQKIERESIIKLMKMYPGKISRVTRGSSAYRIHLNF